MRFKAHSARHALAAAVAATVFSSSAFGAITNRYSFNGNANDGVGVAHGTTFGNADFATNPGQLTFNGTDTYVRLPSVLPTTAGSSVSIEIWGTYDPLGGGWERIFDFGRDTNNNFFLTPKSGPNDTRVRIKSFNNNEQGPIIPGVLTTGSEEYLVAVLDGVNRTLSLYQNGSRIGNPVTVNIDTSNIVQTNNYIGRSQWPDPLLRGSINEFRIHNSALTPYRMAINMALGPDQFTLPTNTWQGGVGAWEDAGNWTMGTPTTAQVALINNGGHATLTSDVGTIATVRPENGTFTIGTGGNILTGLDLAIGNAGGATVNINGGRLALGEVLTDAGTASKAINFDNGTFAAESDLLLTIPNLVTTVNAGGATVDSGAFNVVWGGTWNGAGDLTKTGTGTLRITNPTALAGDFRIKEGTLTTGANLGQPGAVIELGDMTGASGGAVALLTSGEATIAVPIVVGSSGSGNATYRIGGSANVNTTFSGPITLNKDLIISQVATTGTNALTVAGDVTAVNGAPTLVTFQGGGRINVTGALTQTGGSTLGIVKDNGGTTTLSGANTFTGPITVNGGRLVFPTPANWSGSGANTLINAGGAVVIGPTFTNLQTTVLPRIDPASAGTLAISASTAENLDFATPGLSGLFLGAAEPVTYTGTITPAGGAYRLGGGGGVLTLPNANAITGDNALIVGGAGGGGAVVLSGTSNNYTGDTTINAGATLQVSSPAQMGSGTNLTITNGTLRVTGDTPFVLSQNTSVAGAVLDIQNTAGTTVTGPVAATNNTAVQKQGTGPLTIASEWLLAGAPTWFRNGTTTVGDGGSVTTNGFLSVGLNPDLPLDDNATLIVRGTGRVTGNGDFNVGDVDVRGVMRIQDEATVQASGLWLGKFGPLAEGVVVQTGGTLQKVGTGAPEWQIGGSNDVNGRGSYWITGGTFDTGISNLQIGATGKGIMTINGGTVTSGGWHALARFGAGSVGVMDMTAGTFNQTHAGRRFIVSEQGQGTLNMRGGELNVGSGNTQDALDMGIANSANATVNLLGGTLTTLSVGEANATNAATSHFNFNGGTLRAAATNPTFMSGLDHAYVHSGGAVIDTNAFDITIAQPLEAPTGNGVTTIPITNGGSGYIAPPLVVTDETSSGGQGARAVATIDPATGAVTGIVITNPGVGYTAPPTFTIVGGGGTGATLGTATIAPNNTSGGLTKNGEGTLTLTGDNTYTGPTTVNAGHLVTKYVRGGPVTIGANTSLTLSPDGGISETTALNIAGTTDAWTGKLDVTNNDIIVRTAGGAARETAYANALNQAKSGLAEASGNFWSGNGITSSTAAATGTPPGTLTAVGIILNDFAKAGLPPGPIVNEFGGRPVTENDILMKYTWFGDADLSGVVDGTDYFLIDQAFAAGTLNGGWLNGDFNYDGKVDGTDYFLIDQAFSAQTGPLSASASAVPEPSTLGLLALTGLLARRRRK